MSLFGKTLLKHKMLNEELTNEYRGISIPVSAAIEVASRAMNIHTVYDFESCLAVMREAFNANDDRFEDSVNVDQAMHGR